MLMPIKYLLAFEPEDLDQYGGYKGITFPATGNFYTTKADDQWWVVTPEGNAMFMTGIGAVNLNGGPDSEGLSYSDHVQNKYQSLIEENDSFGSNWQDRWAYYTRKRLKEWGFNHLGTFAFPPASAKFDSDGNMSSQEMGNLPDNKMPQVITNRAGRDSMGADKEWRVKNIYGPVFTLVQGSRPFFPDVFDPKFKESQEYAASISNKDSQWIVFVFMDQTDEMRGVDITHNHLGFVSMATNFKMQEDSRGFLGAQTYSDSKMYTKYAARDFLREKYSTLEALNSAWGTSYTSWDSDGGWGAGTGVLDENGSNLGADWGKENPQGIVSHPAVKEDLEKFAEKIMRKWYKTVYEAFKSSGSKHILSTNNFGTPKEYCYKGMISEDGNEVYADLVAVQLDPEAGKWSDILEKPFSAFNLDGFFTAENDSPLGYSGTVSSFTFDDVAKTITVTCDDCNFYWAGNPLFSPVHNFRIQFSSLPETIIRGATESPQHYRSAPPADFIDNKTFIVRESGYYNGKYTELRDAIKIGDSFKRVVFFNNGPFETQEERGQAYASQLQGAVLEQSPKGTYFKVGAHLWQWKDNSYFFWEIYNFGLVTHRDNAYDGQEACFDEGTDSNGFTRLAETRPPHINSDCFGNYIKSVSDANFSIYSLRPNTVPDDPAPNIVTATYNLSNFISLIDNWLQTGDENSDVNLDSAINTRDLGIMMSNWSN